LLACTNITKNVMGTVRRVYKHLPALRAALAKQRQNSPHNYAIVQSAEAA
jgi:hypothetical protein